MPPYRVIFARRGAKFEVVIMASTEAVATKAGTIVLSNHVGRGQVDQWTHLSTTPETISLDTDSPTEDTAS